MNIPDLSDKTVLVADDFESSQQMISLLLRKYKIKVDCVSNGKEVLELIKSGKPVYDAIFMDHIMPEMDGMEATRQIRSLATDYSSKIPIFAMTANIIDEKEQMFLGSGFSDCISKPINTIILQSLLNKWFCKKTNENENRKETGHHHKKTGFSLFNSNIPGIDMKVVKDFYDGDEELAIFAFNSFIVYSPTTIEKIQTVSAENLKTYAITVHSLKSTTASVGALEMNKKAARLQELADEGNLSGVLAENEEFVHKLQSLIEDMKAALS